jgi:hypothetical protein
LKKIALAFFGWLSLDRLVGDWDPGIAEDCQRVFTTGVGALSLGVGLGSTSPRRIRYKYGISQPVIMAQEQGSGVEQGLTIGACGRFCSGCQFFNKECGGCIEENERLERKCIVYQCVQQKNVRYCLQCPVTIPKCDTMRGISKSYCLVDAIKKERGKL